jgi:hypothetical protein
MLGGGEGNDHGGGDDEDDRERQGKESWTLHMAFGNKDFTITRTKQADKLHVHFCCTLYNTTE